MAPCLILEILEAFTIPSVSGVSGQCKLITSDFEKTVKEIIHKARAKGLAAGIHFPAHPEYQIKWVKEGANIVLHSSDMRLFSQKLSEDLSNIKKAVGDSHNLSTGSDLAI